MGPVVDEAAAGREQQQGPAAPGPRWLHDDEQRTWRDLLAMTQLLQVSLDRQMRAEAGMPQAYYTVLAMLSEAPARRLRMSELAAITTSSPSRISHAVTRLEEKGWVARSRAADDGRGAVAALTDEGWDVLHRTAPGHVEHVRRALFDPLSAAQRDQLGEICRAVLGALAEAPHGARRDEADPAA
ncbi:MarR family winged helix-turn-helix transcriptional regulator [uncultured Pseudokineococcus sp.]|uniref:MarR family winged helix-turn-helix transcriptional regulator n=1 Tax=uncultured Pseudokineococcus sp. TaxID=1642928 RepID=UPI0026191D6F|nr:MarR family transcriptional regulator [uncultured Pseudokineococcus sp.]